MAKLFSGGDKVQGFIAFLSLLLISLQIFALVAQSFGWLENIRLGAGLMLVIIVGLILLAFVAVRERAYLQGRDILILILAGALMLFLLFKLPQLVPSIFSQAISELQSMLGVS